ncbi:MAG: aminotransferase [Lachnospiraceae bacterium]|nr:aminotransferase [Lachnospiraceae bacterium]
MIPYDQMTREDLLKEKESLVSAYKKYEKMELSLNMARGKPSVEQLDLSMGMLAPISHDEVIDVDSGMDVRNYGVLEGLEGAKKLLASMVSCDPNSVIVCGNSSLNVMYDQIARGFSFGYLGEKPWSKLKKVKWLCPVPGYDRHFSITEHFGFEMIPIPMNSDGPDMDLVEEYVKDDSVKGIWCVPKYSNPEGIVYSEEVVKRFANLKPAAKDFRIFWDNAYAVHYLYDEIEKQDQIPDILLECKKAGNPNLVFEFMSTSKISFSGSGISGVASSPENKKDIISSMTVQTIGYDKVNQLRHIKFFKDAAGIREHMKKHAKILRPKFLCVINTLERDLSGKNVGTWNNPNGGYFITFRTIPNVASKVVSMCFALGVTLTGAGAPFPYGQDPKDSVIRIAPSFPTLEELQTAMDVFTLCVRLATIDEILKK